jgi:hypothetical protein
VYDVSARNPTKNLNVMILEGQQFDDQQDK